MFNEIDLAYTAGIIDGEGSISISKLRNKWVKSRRGYDFQLAVAVGIREKVLCEWLQLKFGGSIFHKSQNRENPNHCDIYSWRLTRGNALPFLRVIEPYLKLKNLQAKNAIEFQESINPSRSDKLKDSEWAVREAQCILMGKLNHPQGSN